MLMLERPLSHYWTSPLTVNPPFMFSFFSQTVDKTVLYGIVSTFVNLTNSYDIEKPDPKMVELARYAKQHIPEEHPKVTL